MTGHTPEPLHPEPWHAEFKPEDVRLFVCTKKDEITMNRDVIAVFDERENGERAIACVNGCAGLNPAAYQRLVAACQALLAKEKDMNTGALYLECRDIEAALHRAEGRG